MSPDPDTGLGLDGADAYARPLNAPSSGTILWISHTGRAGGAELCLLEAVGGLAERRIASHVILPERRELWDRLALRNVLPSVLRYTWWAHKRSAWIWRVLRAGRNILALPSVMRVMLKVRPDVVITNTISTPVGALAARMLGIPHVWFLHEFGIRDHGMRFDLGSTRSLAMIDYLSDRIVVASKTLEAWYAPHFRKKLYVVHGAVEVPPVEGQLFSDSEGPLRLVMVGRLAPGKRQEDAIRAIDLLRERGISVVLTLVGDEDPVYGSSLRQLCTELGLNAEVIFEPFAADPHRHVLAADVSLMCSDLEAFGRVTVEAMKLGRPVIGTDSGGTAELIEHGWNGLLFPPRNVEALADRIEQLHRDRALVRRLGENAYNRSRSTFSRARFADELIGVIEPYLRTN